MDLNSWKPEDTARRMSIMFSACVGMFVLLAAWLAYNINPLLAMLLGVLAAVAVFWPLYLGLLAYYRR